MKGNWKKLLLFLAIPLAVGGLSALVSGGMGMYQELVKPPLSPPGWLFPIVWSVLYLLMGWASYRVYTWGQDRQAVKGALILYGVQLAVNFLWPVVFFRFGLLLTAFLVLLVLWVLVFFTMRAFSRIDETAGDLLIPYFLWVTFAGYLNLGFFLLN